MHATDTKGPETESWGIRYSPVLVNDPLRIIRLGWFCLLFNGRDCQIRRSTECPKPWTLSFLELAKDTTLEVDYRRYPFILIFGTIVGGGEYRDFCSFYFFAMGVLHFVVTSHEHPARLVTKSDDFGVFHILSDVAIFILEPFGKSLDCESRRG